VRDADHSPASSAEVVNEYELYLLSPCACRGKLWWDCFTFTQQENDKNKENKRITFWVFNMTNNLKGAIQIKRT
jgi:hypothetical protein